MITDKNAAAAPAEVGAEDLFVAAGATGLCAGGRLTTALGRSAGPVCRGCGGRHAGRVAEKAEDFGVQPLDRRY
jgi:hypothetical protein